LNQQELKVTAKALKEKYYVNNKEFFAAVVSYKNQLKEAREAELEKPRMPNYLGDCFYKIACRYIYHPWFRGYDFKEEMISDAVLHCVKYVDTFDPAKTTNAFSYFTQTIHNAFRYRVEKEKRYLYTKYKAIENTEIFKSSGDAGDVQYSDNAKENRSDFIATYEKTKIKPRKNAKKKK
jgi:hypothetical protein